MSCQHPGCRCQEATVELNGRKFCSEICARIETSGVENAQCTCGHLDCAAA